MKRTLIFLALLCPAPVAWALEPAPNSSTSPDTTSSPAPGPSTRATPTPTSSATPGPPPLHLQTLVADKNLRLTLSKIAPECRILRVALLRKDELLPGFGAFNRPVRVDQVLGRVVTLVLGPEFQPHSYGMGDIRLSCFDASGKPLSNLVNLINKAPLALDQNEVLVDVSTAFGPGAADEKHP